MYLLGSIYGFVTTQETLNSRKRVGASNSNVDLYYSSIIITIKFHGIKFVDKSNLWTFLEDLLSFMKTTKLYNSCTYSVLSWTPRIIIL